jgi:hypothetical protein
MEGTAAAATEWVNSGEERKAKRGTPEKKNISRANNRTKTSRTMSLDKRSKRERKKTK